MARIRSFIRSLLISGSGGGSSAVCLVASDVNSRVSANGTCVAGLCS